MPPSGDVAVVIPARNESDRIRATVTAAAGLPGGDVLVVVDDGSHDGTAATAARAGATVVRHARCQGKSAAMETGAGAGRPREGGGGGGGRGRGGPPPREKKGGGDPPPPPCFSSTRIWPGRLRTPHRSRNR